MLSSEPNGALIAGEYKLILGVQSYGIWMSPVYPNATTNTTADKPVDCGAGCLFDIQADPSEYHDLAKSMPDKLLELQALWRRLNGTTFEAPAVRDDPTKCRAYVRKHHGFLGPYLDTSERHGIGV